MVIDELIAFGRQQYGTAWAPYTDEQLGAGLLAFKDTTIVRTERGKITGFCCYRIIKGIAEIFLIAGIGDRMTNFRIMKNAIRKCFGGKVKILSEK